MTWLNYLLASWEEQPVSCNLGKVYKTFSCSSEVYQILWVTCLQYKYICFSNFSLRKASANSVDQHQTALIWMPRVSEKKSEALWRLFSQSFA